MVALCRVGETFWTGAWENPQAECLLPSGGCTPTQYHLPLTPKRREWYHTFREFTDVKRATRSSTRCLMTTVQLLNTTGAARRLGCSVTWIYQLVSTGKLKAYLYDPTGVLIERKPQGKRKGQGLYFFSEDVDAYHSTVQTRYLMTTAQVLNTTGTARRLGYSATWIHELVSAGKLKAYLYDPTGVLVERKPEEKCPGQGLYFLPQDVDAYHPAVRGRPRGSKTKQPRSRSARGKNGLNVVRL